MATNDQKKQAREKREQAQAAAEAAAKRNRNLQMLIGAVLAAVAVVILVVIVSGGKDTPDQGIADDVSSEVQGVAATKTLLEGIEQDGLSLGDPKAPVTVVEFVDVQCPFCRNHQLDEQPKVVKELVRTGKARLTSQPIALPQMGEDSEAGRTVLVRLAEQNKAWDFLNLFYFNQGEEATGYVTDDYLKKLVAAIPGTKPADAAREPDEAIRASLTKIDDLSKTLGVTGTPSFAIGKTGEPASSYKLLTLSGSESIGDQLIKAVNDFKG